MKKLTTLSLFIVFTTILFSCTDTPTNQTEDSTDQVTENGNALVEITASWSELGNPPPERFSDQNSNLKAVTTSSSIQKANNEITHFGIRVEYFSDDAVFSQSVENSDGESTALITLDIPTADSVAVYAVAVDSDFVINMGVIKSTTLSEATSYNFQVDDFNWFAPSWGAGADFEVSGWDTARVSAAEAQANIEFDVVNPYDSPNKSDYSNFIMRLNGTGGIGDYKGDDIREYWVAVENPNQGTQDTVRTSYAWSPYLDGTMFNLPSGRYTVDEASSFVVIFEE